MPRETNAAKRERAIETCRRLNERYGPVECFLDHASPFRLVISVLLSAQTTDAQVNKVTPALFERWPTPQAMAGATAAEVAEVIKSLGVYKTKAKHCADDRRGLRRRGAGGYERAGQASGCGSQDRQHRP